MTTDEVRQAIKDGILDAITELVSGRRNPGSTARRSSNALEWLTTMFQSRHSWPSNQLMELAEQNGISRNAIFEAKGRIGDAIKVKKVTDEYGSHWEWEWLI